MNFLVDTNILVRLSDTASSLHSVCRRAVPGFLDRGDVLFICSQVMIEYWVVVTRPADVNGLGFEPAQAEADVRDFENWFEWLSEPADIAIRWRALVNNHAVRGKRAHDARIVALMEAHGLANLLTFNAADFAGFAGVVCVSPSSYALPTRKEDSPESGN
jgi:predicted nucleic acid-binding protein